MRSWGLLGLMVCAWGNVAHAQTSTALDAKVQTPQLAAPERGSLVGQLSGLVYGPADVERGTFTVPAPMSAPSDRGALLADIFPVYSPEGGMSEWGMGWNTSLAVTRTRLAGDLDYATDGLTGPWGRMEQGSDGYWYPMGLSRLVRMVWSGDTMVAYLPDGTQLTFGGALRQSNARGTYLWPLVDVVTVTGRRTNLVWQPNVSGRLYLLNVCYGGIGTDYQYRVDFSYEELAQPFTDYRSGVGVVLDQRVKQVTMMEKYAGTGTFGERWHYELAYQSEGVGPANFLTAVQQVFRSGEKPPPAVYAYNYGKDKLAAADLLNAPNVASLLNAFGWSVLQPDRSTKFDVEEDGLLDVERSLDFAMARQTESGFSVEPLPPETSTTDLICRPPPSNTNAPRTLVRLRAGVGDNNPYVATFQPSGGRDQTLVRVCSRNGTIVGGTAVDGSWAPSATVRLVDLNRDFNPDLIRVTRGRYTVLPNTSTTGIFSFGAARQGQLNTALTPDTIWVQDFNGDGIPDLITRTSGSVVVWYGKGNFEFDPDGSVFVAKALDGSSFGSLSGYSLTFVDANKDGLTDLLLTSTKTNRAILLINTGATFQEVDVPGLLKVSSDYSKPIIADLSGSGNTEVSYTKDGQGYAVALDGPETGLMATADDGRGTVLTFGYGRTGAFPGQKRKHSVLASLSVQSSGYDNVSYAYVYGTPYMHRVGQFLVGFDQVTKRAPLMTDVANFWNDDRFSGVLQWTRRQDLLLGGLEQFEVRTYGTNGQDAVYRGIPWKRLSRTEKGYRTPTSPPIVVSERTDVPSYWSEYCPYQTQVTSAEGVLTATKTYASLPAFQYAMACLVTDDLEVGVHANSAYDFRYETSIDRNAVGQPTAVRSVAPEGTWTLQEIVYQSDWLVKTVSSPGKGTTQIDYDPETHLPYQVTAPDGSFAVVTARDPLTDALLGLAQVHGKLAYQQSFRFDGQERLWKKWDDLTGLTSEAQPQISLAYRYATASQPGAVTQFELVDAAKRSGRTTVGLVTASGADVVTAQKLPQGWAFGPLKSRSVNKGETWTYQRAAIGGATSPATMDYATLLTGTQLIQDTVASALGYVDDTTWFHSDVSRRMVTWLEIQSNVLMKVSQENGGYYTAQAMDAGGRVLAFWDEAGTLYQYQYDALGRLRDVALPDGNHHRVFYDGHGRVSRIEREGVVQGQKAVAIDYHYDPVSGLLHSKITQSPDGKLATTLTNSYDAIGRVKVEQYTDSTSGVRGYQYYYDGATPAKPNDISAIGYLTAVSGDEYQKIITPRADGLPTRTTTVLTGWRTVESDLSYLEGGALSERTVQVTDASGKLLSSSNYVEHYGDGAGRVTSTALNGVAFATYGYDENGNLQNLVFANGDWSRLIFDSTTRLRVGSIQYTPGWTGGATQRFNERGLVDNEGLAIGNTSFARQYLYSSQRFLKSSIDPQNQYSYDYDPFGLPTQIQKNEEAAKALVRSGSTMTAGSVMYQVDGLGRTIQRGDLKLTYGPDGQVATATRGGSVWSFVYDEKGQRLVKFTDGKPVAAYLDEGYLDAGGLSEPVRFAGRTVGLVRNGSVQLIATDPRGTVLGEADGTPRNASPFGDRDVHPVMAAAIDYVEKGWDADLGLVRMGMRDYDPAISSFMVPDGRFVEDPAMCLRVAVECDLYAYARGNPISFVDPTGQNGISSFMMDTVLRYGAPLPKETMGMAVDRFLGRLSEWGGRSLVVWSDLYDRSNGPLGGTAVTLDSNSVRSHTTGWTEVNFKNNPQMAVSFSLLKTVVAYRIAELPGLNKVLASAVGAGAVGLTSDALTLQARIDYKSIEVRQWAGTVEWRLSLTGGLAREISHQWSGSPERVVGDASLKYRILGLDRVLFESRPEPFPGFGGALREPSNVKFPVNEGP
jgi:RHS repeat-associated protein